MATETRSSAWATNIARVVFIVVNATVISPLPFIAFGNGVTTWDVQCLSSRIQAATMSNATPINVFSTTWPSPQSAASVSVVMSECDVQSAAATTTLFADKVNADLTFNNIRTSNISLRVVVACCLLLPSNSWISIASLPSYQRGLVKMLPISGMRQCPRACSLSGSVSLPMNSSSPSRSDASATGSMSATIVPVPRRTPSSSWSFSSCCSLTETVSYALRPSIDKSQTVSASGVASATESHVSVSLAFPASRSSSFTFGQTMTRSIECSASSSLDDSGLVLIQNAPSIVGTAAKAASGVVGFAGALSFAPEISALGLVALMECSGPAAKASTGPLAYTVSPFIDFGREWMVLGNGALMIGVATVHFLICLGVSATSKRELSEWAVKFMFPNISMHVAVFLMNGAFFASASLMSSSTPSAFSSGAAIVVALVGLTGTVTFVVGCFLFTRLQLLPLITLTREDVASERSNVMQVLLPSGKWLPSSVVSRYGIFFNSMSEGNVPFAQYPLWYALGVSLIASLSPPQDKCWAQYAAAALWSAGSSAFVAIVRPNQCTIVIVLNSAIYLTNGVVFGLLSLIAGSVLERGSSSSDTVLAAVIIIQSLLSIIKALHTIWLFVVKRLKPKKSSGTSDQFLAVLSDAASDWRQSQPKSHVMVTRCNAYDDVDHQFDNVVDIDGHRIGGNAVLRSLINEICIKRLL